MQLKDIMPNEIKSYSQNSKHYLILFIWIINILINANIEIINKINIKFYLNKIKSQSCKKANQCHNLRIQREI